MKGNPLWKGAPGGMSRRGSLEGLVSPGAGIKALGARGAVSDSSEEADPERGVSSILCRAATCL